MFLLPPFVPGNQYRQERFEMFADTQLQNYDIICFQEFFHIPGKSKRTAMINHGIQKGLKYSCYSPFPVWAAEGKFGDGGLIILSRYPMVQSRFCPFKAGASADKLAMKGILYAQIILPCTSDKKTNIPAAHE